MNVLAMVGCLVMLGDTMVNFVGVAWVVGICTFHIHCCFARLLLPFVCCSSSLVSSTCSGHGTRPPFGHVRFHFAVQP